MLQVWSTVNSVQPGGFMRRYIELGQLAHIHGNALFVHGGIVGGGCEPDTHAVGAMPPSAVAPGEPNERIDDVHEWVAALNAWKDAQVEEWIRQPEWSGERPQPELSARSSASDDVTPHGSLVKTPWRTRDDYVLSGGGQALQDYGLFTDNGPTVVLGRHLQKTGMPVRATSCGLLNSVLLLDLS
jgi:hypothetical protein